MAFIPQSIHERRIIVTSRDVVLGGVVEYQGDLPVRIELLLDETLKKLGASFEMRNDVSTSKCSFAGPGVHRFGLLIPPSRELIDAGRLRARISVIDDNSPMKTELDSIEVDVEEFIRVVDISAPYSIVLDVGGESTVGARLDKEGLRPFDGFPAPSAIGFNINKNQFVPWEGDVRDQAGVICIQGLKRFISETDNGPRSAHPYHWPEIIRLYLEFCLRRCLDQSGGLPQSLIATYPAGWNSAQRRCFEDLLRGAMAANGMSNLEIRFVDEATSGGIGTIQELVERFGGSGSRMALLGELNRPVYYLTLDIGNTTTDVSLGILSLRHLEGGQDGSYPRFEATTHLRGIAGLPFAGWAFTRLLGLMLLARLAERHPAFTRLPASVSQSISQLAVGEIDDFDDPVLSGANERSQSLLEGLTALLSVHDETAFEESRLARSYLFEVAERLKLSLNSPDAHGHYPESVVADQVTLTYWHCMAAFHGLAPEVLGLSGPFDLDLDDASLKKDLLRYDSETQERLFGPAIRKILGLVAGMGRIAQLDVQSQLGETREKGVLPEPRVSFICLTGRGSLLRELRDTSGKIVRGSLPIEHFDLHPSRILLSDDPKFAVARGALAFYRARDEVRTWIWDARDVSYVLPYDIGDLSSEKLFIVRFHRGSKLPCWSDVEGSVKNLKVYRQNYVGGPEEYLGHLEVPPFDSTPGGVEGRKPQIYVDENRDVFSRLAGGTSQHSGDIYSSLISPPSQMSPFEPPELLSYEDKLMPRAIW